MERFQRTGHGIWHIGIWQFKKAGYWQYVVTIPGYAALKGSILRNISKAIKNR